MNRVDVKCRICLSILIKPVILPCTHEFCLECFEKHMTLASGSCPLCRRRVGCWARQAKRNHSLVNELRWQTIKKNFPDIVNKRLSTLEGSSDTEGENDSEPNMAKQKNIETKMRENKVVEKLQGFNSCTTVRILPRVSNAEKPGCSGVTTTTPSTSNLEAPKLLPKRSPSVESVDSISPELNHFRPIKSEPKTPPRRTPQENIVLKPCSMIAKPQNLDLSDDRSGNSRPFPAPLTSLLPRWLHMTSAENSCVMSPKTVVNVNNMTSEVNSELAVKRCRRAVNHGGVANENRAVEKRSTCRKRQQEMDDFKLALKIQKNINKGLYDVDRSCSGDSPYYLRKRNPQNS